MAQITLRESTLQTLLQQVDIAEGLFRSVEHAVSAGDAPVAKTMITACRERYGDAAAAAEQLAYGEYVRTAVEHHLDAMVGLRVALDPALVDVWQGLDPGQRPNAAGMALQRAGNRVRLIREKLNLALECAGAITPGAPAPAVADPHNAGDGGRRPDFSTSDPAAAAAYAAGLEQGVRRGR